MFVRPSKVKRETNKHNDEIELLAAKIREANKSKMAMINSTNVNNFQQKQVSYLSEMSSFGKNATLNIDDIYNDDFGKFGWCAIGKQHIPYIFRDAEKYVSVKIIEEKVISKFLPYLNPDIYTKCTHVKSVYMTDIESRLFTEINMKHCDCQFGKSQFTMYDLMVTLQDAKEFYNFLEHVYSRLMNASIGPKRMGYFVIDDDAIVGYVVSKKKQYVPLFFFESDEVNLREKAKVFKDWDMAYLKFLCMLQGVKSELYMNDATCEVVNVKYLEKFFDEDTSFIDYWPDKMANIMDTKLLMTHKQNRGMRGLWTQKPTQLPVVPAVGKYTNSTTK